ncbi:MAG: division/cell wall cluster transcriptional repressor MraZ [Parvibaculum sp.]
MESFRGRFTNKIDSKGRISVPAKFRAVSVAQGLNGVICFPPLSDGRFIEGCGPSFSDEIDRMLARLDPFSPERDALASVLLGESAELMFDADGRVILPENLRELAGIRDEATFVGAGQRFQIWEPKAYEAYHIEAKKQVPGFRELLKSTHVPPAPDSGGSR